MKSSILLALILILPCLSFAQPTYLIGSGQESIEPDQSLISLHLAGYGGPREGRFTLQWINKGVVPEVSAMASADGKLFILNKADLLVMNPSESNPVWKKAGKGENIKSLAGLNDMLYALSNNSEILESKAKSIKWKKIGTADRSATAIAAIENRIYVSNENGLLWSADVTQKSFEWLKLASPENTVGLTAKNKKLYALTKEGVIYQCEPSRKDYKWLKIGYKNGQTVKEDIIHIAVVNDRLFGISKDNYLYKGEHRSEGNLTARAMVIKSGKETAVIVNVDVCGLNDTFTGLVKQEILQKKSIPPSAVFINCSHTHFAPVSQDWLTWQEPNQRPDSIYLYSIVKNGIINAIENALKTIAPAELYFGRGSVRIGYNRSLKDHPELYDTAVDVIKVNYTGKKEDSYLFLAACHPVFGVADKLFYTVSANYPGIARKLVEERTGTKNSLFLQGTAGDINPKDTGQYVTGEKLANQVIAVLNRPMKKITGSISYSLDTINIPITPKTREEILAFRAKNDDNMANISTEKNVKWSDLMLKYYNEGTMPTSLPVYVNTINIGNWKLVGFSRETTTAYGFGVKNLWPDKLISVAGYTNDVSSYLPNHLHLERAGYEGLDSFYWYGMPNVFPVNVEETILNRIKFLNR